jgi:hypothetical protein
MEEVKAQPTAQGATESPNPRLDLKELAKKANGNDSELTKKEVICTRCNMEFGNMQAYIDHDAKCLQDKAKAKEEAR